MSHLNILLVVLALAITGALSELCHPQDKQTLLQIKKELGNPDSLSSWIPTNDCCKDNWEAISCGTEADSYRVYALVLKDLNLPKPYPIPPSIGNLPYLKFLSISFTQNIGIIPNIVGPIPPTITKLTMLRQLTITNTNISGHIPYFLSQIKTLDSIDLSYNKLSGYLPTWLPSLPNLISINLDSNRFSGPIPDSFGSFRKGFWLLSLAKNRLTGKIPATFAKLDGDIVDLSMNKLDGDASLLFGPRKYTMKIFLQYNMFAFDFGKLEFPKTLVMLDVSHNRIYGTLPKGLATLKNLVSLDVSYNNLCGKIPQGGNMKFFTEYVYAHNKCLCGSPLPSCKHF
ncbi:hypothetical protein VNO78_11441 [Psophocarpus tetragonolobus]|uniref:Leucine-rich repeat-containing N-terminal plant-type domain-containing protein n=1 Tax=Psophocarpus tetragonolobus TaxID=3891 RepID=A0AAN9XNP3_PSOTE